MKRAIVMGSAMAALLGGMVDEAQAAPNANDKKPTEDSSSKECRYRATGSLPVLVIGAVSQRITLEAVDAEAKERCSLKSKGDIELTVGDFQATAAKMEDDASSGRTSFSLTHQKQTATVGLQEFEIKEKGKGNRFGIAMIEVVPAISVDKKIAVSYDLSALTVSLDRYRTFFDGTTVNDDGVAAQNPLVMNEKQGPVIMNQATLQISPKIPTPLGSAWTKLDPKLPKVVSTPLGVKTEDTSELIWAVKRSAGDVWFSHVTDLYSSNEGNRTDDTYQIFDYSPGTVTFSVPKGTSGAIQQKLVLLKVVRTYLADGNRTPVANRVEPILEVDLTLAEKTRRESVPLPIHDLLQVSCNEAVTSIGHAYSAASDDLKINACKLTFRKSNTDKPCFCKVPPEPTPWDEMPSEIRELFGPQRIATKVMGAGANGEETIWPASIVDDSAKIPLKTNVTNDPIAGVYEIEGRIMATHDDLTHYRGQTAEKLAVAADPRFTFKATVRPRGTVDFKTNFRLYMTAFVPVTGLRIGAAATELKSSTDYANFQLVEPKLGLLLGFERYVHALGKNTWPLQPSAQLGMNLVSLANGGFVPTFLVGGSATIPFVETSTVKLGPTLTLGAYYEFDPRVSNQYAHHFLLTLGLNVGALLSASSR